MKLAIAYSTKDQVELSHQTLPRIQDIGADIFWGDGSQTQKGMSFFFDRDDHLDFARTTRVFGGPDAAIAWKLSTMLASPDNYTHIGLIENDVLLDSDWLEPTLALFDIGKLEGLSVGAVSPRSYVDRVLIQRDGYAVMHNIGAGAIIFTREAAEIVLRTFRTHWWPDNVRLFAQLSGIDLRTFACFRSNEQFITTDWGWEAQLARHGLASLALTPARCTMVGQNPPLAQQGLELTTGRCDAPLENDGAFKRYRLNLQMIREGRWTCRGLGEIHQENGNLLFFPHQMKRLTGTLLGGAWRLKRSQGFGPFAYRAGPGGASVSVRVSGSCSFLCSGDENVSQVKIEDARSGFSFSPSLPAQEYGPISIEVPGGPVPRVVTADFSEGATLYGLSCADPQMLDETYRFDWSELPEV